jgi:fatty-acyl-CoA synthase
MAATISEAVEWWAVQTPLRTAFAMADDRVSYAELNSWVDNAAHWLAQRNIVPGDRVAVLGSNSLAWCVAALAIIKCGAILVPLNFRYARPELEALVGDCAPKLALVQADRWNRAAGFGALGTTVSPLEDVNDLRRREPKRFVRDLQSDAPIVIGHTSGSTAKPKGVVFTHRSMLTYTFEAQLNSPELRSAMSLLSVSPLYASSGIVKLVQFLAMGATAVIEPDFDAERALDLLTREKIEVFSGVPIFYERMAACRDFATADLSNLKFCSVAGARVPASLLEAWRAKGVIVRQGYGLSEGGGNTTVNSAENAIVHPEQCGSGGIFTKHRIVGSDGTDCRPNEAGEIWLRGPAMMQGYWNNPAATRAAFVDGWLRTGDVGVMDERGQITFVDRMKDLIISGGLNISPLDIEGAIGDLDGVVEVAVIGVPDPVFAETPMAIVHLSKALATGDIIAHCNARLADYKVPRYLAFADEPLPRLATGKIAKQALREKYRDAAKTMNRVR